MPQAVTTKPPTMPPTRYQGSKRKLAGWIADRLQNIEFDTVLDAFGGTGSVGYEFKRRGKSVTYNDLLRCNHLIGQALIENDRRRLTDAEIDEIATRCVSAQYGDFVEQTFSGIYFTDDENRWIDAAVANIERIDDAPGRAMAFYALFQSALAKRPYNLFHRRNLYMRHADVTRSFGNKSAWDRPFDAHFRKFAAEANEAVFDNGRICRAINRNAIDVEGEFDLVYIDPPYVNAKGVGVNYFAFYHFLEGLTDYHSWEERIDRSSKHLRLTPVDDPWVSAKTVASSFDSVFQRFADSTIAVSYRSDGIPSIEEIQRLLEGYGKRVTVHTRERRQYALSTNRRTHEVLIVAT